MQQQHLFEYAVVRIVPQVEREEFLNVGVILYCPKQKFLQVKFKLHEERFKLFSCELDIAELRSYLQGFERICVGGNDSGPIGKLPIAERLDGLLQRGVQYYKLQKYIRDFVKMQGKSWRRFLFNWFHKKCMMGDVRYMM